MRLDKLLANMGYGSRKEAKKLLRTNVVQVDGKPVKDGSLHLNPEQQTVTVAGKVVDYQPYIYLMLNKPKGVISATEDQRHRTVIDLLPQSFRKYEPFPVGRLDKDTEGLLLITNDGAFAHSIMSPKRDVEKTYWATVQGTVTEADGQLFKEGVLLGDEEWTKPARLVIVEKGMISKVKLTITEGKYHQVKRMFAAVDKKVLELKRCSIGQLQLDKSLAPGELRELTNAELASLVQ